jgi:hypothetical protein
MPNVLMFCFLSVLNVFLDVVGSSLILNLRIVDLNVSGGHAAKQSAIITSRMQVSMKILRYGLAFFISVILLNRTINLMIKKGEYLRFAFSFQSNSRYFFFFCPVINIIKANFFGNKYFPLFGFLFIIVMLYSRRT